MKPRGPRIVAAAMALAMCGLVSAPVSMASEPSGSDTNGRAILVVCPDGYGDAVAVDPVGGGGPGDCESLSDALAAAVSNGVPDDLILLRPGYYCPVDLPNTYGRLYLQGIPRVAWASSGSAEAPTRSDVERVTFSSYANDSCGPATDGAIIHASAGTNVTYLSNLAVDGASTPAGTEGNATYGIEVTKDNTYVRDVVVKRAQVGLKIYGGLVSHSAFVKNVGVGVQTDAGISTWILDTLIADTVNPTGVGIGLFEATRSSLAMNSSTLRNVTITGNELGLSVYPSTYNQETKVRNTLIAGNGVDCDYYAVGQNANSGFNAVGASCSGLAGTTGSQTLSSSEISAINAVDYIDGFEPYADPAWPTGGHLGDTDTCSPTDQLERLRTACYIGAISPIVLAEGPIDPPPISTFVNYPASVDFPLVASGETTQGYVGLSNARDRFVTVSDVSVSAGFAISHDDCSLGFMPRYWLTTGGTPQSYCVILVTANPTGPITGALTVTTNRGAIVIPLTANVLLPLQWATPTIAGTAKVGSAVTAVPGAWTSGTLFSIQWKRNGTNIAGANNIKYTPLTTDRGKTLTVTVTGTKNGYTTVSKTSAAKTVGYGTLTTATPKISGIAKVGKILTAKPGTWKAGTKSATLKYQWYASGKAISGATKSTFTVKSAQVGKKIKVKVTGSSTGYATVAKFSAYTVTVKAR